MYQQVRDLIYKCISLQQQYLIRFLVQVMTVILEEQLGRQYAQSVQLQIMFI